MARATLRYQARRLRARDGSLIGWAVFPGGSLRIAVGFTGPLAWWRAHWQAASLNHTMSRRAR